MAIYQFYNPEKRQRTVFSTERIPSKDGEALNLTNFGVPPGWKRPENAAEWAGVAGSISYTDVTWIGQAHFQIVKAT
jgi:hypothetical protein